MSFRGQDNTEGNMLLHFDTNASVTTVYLRYFSLKQYGKNCAKKKKLGTEKVNAIQSILETLK